MAYLPFGVIFVVLRLLIGFVLWIAAIVLPDTSSVRQLLTYLACWTFGVYVNHKGKRDSSSSLLVANYVSPLDSLAVAHLYDTITLRKWKVPPFFASALGIRNAAQFAKKQHFAEYPSKPILLQPEGGPTNGKGLLKFVDWPFQLGNKVQPVAIKVERMFTNVSVHRTTDTMDTIPWSDTLWYLWTPVTIYEVLLLPPVERSGLEDAAYVETIRKCIADSVKAELTDYSWSDLSSRKRKAIQASNSLLASRVKEVLPHVSMADIIKDLSKTHNVDATITNFLEGVTPYVPESIPEPTPSTSRQVATQPKYVTPAPTGVFPKNPKERELSFQERKAEMIENARRRYIEKHGLQAMNS